MDSLRSLILLEDVKQLLEQITKLCGKISVAKVNLPRLIRPFDTNCGGHVPKQKETSQLAELCRTLSNRLSDHPHGYNDIKRPVHYLSPIHLPLRYNDSKLVKVKEQLTDWSKLNYPKSFSKFGSLPHSP